MDVIYLEGAGCDNDVVVVGVDIGEREYPILYLDARVWVPVVSGCVVHW